MDTLISSEEVKKKFVDFARRSNAKLSIIFGAGASFSYSRKGGYLYHPPTVSKLLEDSSELVKMTIERSEHIAIRSQRLHIEKSLKGLNGDLEAYLSDLYENDKANNLFPSMLRYLEDIFTLASMNVDLDANHYQSLMSRVRDLRGPRPWSILTFNYDTILEQSLASLPLWTKKRAFDSDNDYLTSNPKVLKMHGGINLRYLTRRDISVASPTFHDIFTEMMDNKDIVESYLSTETIASDIPAFKSYERLENGQASYLYNFPLMMIPIHTNIKNENSFFDRQIDHAKNEIAESKLIISIGYQFGDNTFMDALKNVDLKESELILVGSDRLREKATQSKTFKAASKVWPAGNIRIFGDGEFAEFVDALY